MQDSTRRGIRTAIDVILAVATAILATLAVPGLGDAVATLIERGPRDSVGLAAAGIIMAALVALVSKVRNSLEDAGVIPAIIKAPTATAVPPGMIEDDHAELHDHVYDALTEAEMSGNLAWADDDAAIATADRIGNTIRDAGYRK
ncbi:MAG: hypothetical protein RR101_15280 [Burkholderiaceae bacterium]